MSLEFRQLHPHFCAEGAGVTLRDVHDRETLDVIRAAMDRYAVLVFHDQPFELQEQIDFARRLDGELHTKTGARVLQKSRLGTEAVADISNLDPDGQVFEASDRRRMYALGNRLWHTDASFEDPAGRYSMLFAKVVPPGGADTEFADMRAAYDALPQATKSRIEGLTVQHSIAHSRRTLGFEFSAEELTQLQGAVHPLVRDLPRAGRKSLYLASHAARVNEWSLPDGRLLLLDLIEHATQAQFVHRHQWRVGDLVIWDNRATMHRGRPYDDTVHRRELRRVTTLDITPEGIGSAVSESVA